VSVATALTCAVYVLNLFQDSVSLATKLLNFAQTYVMSAPMSVKNLIWICVKNALTYVERVLKNVVKL
jgi:hypothetical protein